MQGINFSILFILNHKYLVQEINSKKENKIMKLNNFKIFIISAILLSNYSFIFSQEQKLEVSPEQAKLQDKLKKSIETFDLAEFKEALAQGAKVNIKSSPTFIKLLGSDTTPLADILAFMTFSIPLSKKTYFDMNQLEKINKVLPMAMGANTALLIFAMTGRIKSKKIKSLSMLAEPILVPLSILFLIIHLYKINLETKHSILKQMIKIIINNSEFELDDVSKKLCADLSMELKELRPLITKISNYKKN